MTIRVLAFARLRELLATPELRVELPDTASANDVWAALLRDHPAIGAERATTRVARNGRLVAFEQSLCDGDELALLPPVGGG
jgi:MoaE-MoaD fusion protein